MLFAGLRWLTVVHGHQRNSDLAEQAHQVKALQRSTCSKLIVQGTDGYFTICKLPAIKLKAWPASAVLHNLRYLDMGWLHFHYVSTCLHIEVSSEALSITVVHV